MAIADCCGISWRIYNCIVAVCIFFNNESSFIATRSQYVPSGNDSVLAVADVNIDDAVIIRDCRLLKSADGNIEAQLPQIKNKDGTYTQTVQLINYQSVLMKSLKASIFEAYTNALKGNPPVSKEKTFEMEKLAAFIEECFDTHEKRSSDIVIDSILLHEKGKRC